MPGRAQALVDTARTLGCSPTTLRRWVAAGAPVVRAGRRGRGGGVLLDPDAVAAWRAGCSGTQPSIAAIAETVAVAIERVFVATAGRPHRHDNAELLAAAGYAVTAALADLLDQAEPSLHAHLDRLRKIGQFR